jgi:hypothetical protein
LKTGIFAQELPTLELWELAARYSFDEMEQYCRKDAKVLRQIDSIVSDPSRGVEYLLSRHLPVPFVSRLVCDLFKTRTQDVAWLRHFVAPSTPPAMAAHRAMISNTFSTQVFGPHIESNFTEIGQNSEHTKAYHNEVKKGRFSYANPENVKGVCSICSHPSTPILLPPSAFRVLR